MKLEIVPSTGRSAAAEPDEIAAILAVLEGLESGAPPAPQAKPSRWRSAARSFDTGAP